MTEPRTLPYTFHQVREKLQANIDRLLRELGFTERLNGPLITPLNPMRDDKKAGSFVIWLDGDRVGAWKDFALSGPGSQGSIIDLVMGVKRLAEPMDAYWWALDWLGLERGTVRLASEDVAQRRREEANRLAREAKFNAELAGKSARAFAWWVSLPPIDGTLAERYLREARGIPLERLHHLPRALRFAAAHDHFDEATGEVTTWPCMVAAMTRGTKVVAVHRTYLDPRLDGNNGKAPVAKAKKMWGPPKGAAIRLTAGVANCSPAEAERRGKSGPLAIGEGIETSLTVACARPDYRVWAAGSLDLIGMIDWPACASAAVLLRDNDSHPTAVAAFERSARRWEDQARGRPLVIAQASVGSDFNELEEA